MNAIVCVRKLSTVPMKKCGIVSSPVVGEVVRIRFGSP